MKSSAKGTALSTFQLQINAGGLLAIAALMVLSFWVGTTIATAQMPTPEAYPLDVEVLSDTDVNSVKDCVQPILADIMPQAMPTDPTQLRQMWQQGTLKDNFRKLVSSEVRDELEGCVRAHVPERMIDRLGSGRLHEELSEIKTQVGQCMQTCMGTTKPSFTNRAAMTQARDALVACMKSTCPDVEFPGKFMGMAHNGGTNREFSWTGNTTGKSGFWGGFKFGKPSASSRPLGTRQPESDNN